MTCGPVVLSAASRRAERWIAGLSALVTVLTAAIVVKGPDDFAKAQGSVRSVVLGLVVAGIVGLGLGLVFAYSAAFGGLIRRSALDRLIEAPPTVALGAAGSLESAASRDAKASRRSMRVALGSTVVAQWACLVAAIGCAWFATSTDEATPSACVRSGGGVVAVAGEIDVRTGTAIVRAVPRSVT